MEKYPLQLILDELVLDVGGLTSEKTHDETHSQLKSAHFLSVLRIIEMKILLCPGLLKNVPTVRGSSMNLSRM